MPAALKDLSGPRGASLRWVSAPEVHTLVEHTGSPSPRRDRHFGRMADSSLALGIPRRWQGFRHCLVPAEHRVTRDPDRMWSWANGA